MSAKSSSAESAVSSGDDVGPMGETFPRWLQAGMCVGPWRILRWLGQGGYGVVYLAEDTRPMTAGGIPGLVAVKLAVGRTPEDDSQARLRLLREGEILRRVIHPHVVRCLEQGTHQEVPYLVLEYVPGPNLYDWSALRNRTAREVVERVGPLLLALKAVHGAGVFHRDLKGENVLIRERDEQPVLLDFGVGDHEGASTLTGSGLPPGTAHYRSPEAVRFLLEDSEQPEARYHFTLADELYAFGVILYRLLTDEYPFSPELPRFILYERIEQMEPPSPISFNPRVPRSVSDLVMRLLSKKPEERGQSTEEVYEALQAALADGDRGWNDLLFEGSDGPSMYSRSTEEGGIVGPAAPGHEVALMHAAAQARQHRWELRKKRALRKRPILPAPPEPAPVAPSRPEPELPRAKTAWALLAVICLTGLLWSLHEMTPPRGASPMSPTQEAPSVKTEKTHSIRPSQEVEDGSAMKAVGHPLEKCAVALAAGLALSACAGVPAQPPQRECPKDALAAMARLKVVLEQPSYVQTDINRPGEYSDTGNFRDGPLVSVFVPELDGRPGQLPPGTLLYGYVWTRGKRIFAQYDRAKLPTGDIIPVCFVFGGGEKPGLTRSWDPSPPGTANLPLEAPVIAVDHFE